MTEEEANKIVFRFMSEHFHSTILDNDEKPLIESRLLSYCDARQYGDFRYWDYMLSKDKQLENHQYWIYIFRYWPDHNLRPRFIIINASDGRVMHWNIRDMTTDIYYTNTYPDMMSVDQFTANDLALEYARERIDNHIEPADIVPQWSFEYCDICFDENICSLHIEQDYMDLYIGVDMNGKIHKCKIRKYDPSTKEEISETIEHYPMSLN